MPERFTTPFVFSRRSVDNACRKVKSAQRFAFRLYSRRSFPNSDAEAEIDSYTCGRLFRQNGGNRQGTLAFTAFSVSSISELLGVADAFSRSLLARGDQDSW